MSRYLQPFVAVLSFLSTPVFGQQYVLRDGRVIDASEVSVRNGQIVRIVSSSGGERAEIGVPLANVVRLNWPEPVDLTEAVAALSNGTPENAVASSEHVVEQFSAFLHVQGSWWGEAMLVRAKALHALGKPDEAARVANALVAETVRPELTALGKVILADIAQREGKRAEALKLLADATKCSAAPAVEAEAAMVLGEIELSRKDFAAALDSFLCIPAFYGGRADLMPRALLGSARAYRGINDVTRAERAVLELTDGFASSPEAKTAKKEFNL